MVSLRMAMKTSHNRSPRTQLMIPAPSWLARRIEALRRMEPPTLKEVEAQLKASADLRKKLTARHAA